MATRVFVYGTLRRQFGNHRLIRGAEFIGPAALHSDLVMVSMGGFPAAMPTPAGGVIHGEVYSLNDEQLAAVDRLEGHPHWYRRQERRVLIEGICPGTLAWVYVMPARDCEGLPVVADGDWLEYARRRGMIA